MNFFILIGSMVFLQLDVCYMVSLKAVTGRQKNNHKNISNLLDSLLKGYENSIRPNYGGAPAEIEVDFMVRSMGPISEVDMTYSMDCYFRQSWVDKRLAFPGDVNDTLALSISMLERIWKPDTYFHNGKQSYLHTITTPNKFVRLYQNGRVLYSSRLTIKAGCPMNLEDFPMDVQRCPLVLGSFGYTTRDVLYKWNSARQVAIAEDMKLSQFDLITSPSSSERKLVVGYHKQKEEYTNLLVSFHLKRHMGNFLIQVYGPCVLLVVLSWVSFWLNREATADRVSLGITTVLTMTFLGLEARNDLPKVPYPTALDYFVFLSFAFIFATIIEFAVVHYFTKYGSGECYFSSDFNSDSSSDEDEVDADENRNAQIAHRRRFSEGNSHISSSDLDAVEVIPLAMYSVPRRNNPPSIKCNCCIGNNHEKIKPPAQVTTSIARPRKVSSSSYHHEVKLKRRKHRTPRFNSVSKIDRASRVVFPFLFLTINVFYWYSYLYKTQRIEQR